jgi:hypothetical protein
MIAGTAPKQWGRFWGGLFPIKEHFYQKTTPNTTPELDRRMTPIEWLSPKYSILNPPALNRYKVFKNFSNE